jgi:Na+/citrate or Na+/malate symporter
VFIAVLIALSVLQYSRLRNGLVAGYFSFFIQILLGDIIIAWFFSVIARIIVAAVQDKPNGVRLFNVVVLLMYGPFRLQIPDYEPDQKQVTSRPTA